MSVASANAHAKLMDRPVRMLLVGPYDPHCGEFTFLAPPLGVWRLCGVLCHAGIESDVFDPNCCLGDPACALESLLAADHWDVIGFSTTGMTLNFDLELAAVAKRISPNSVTLAGGMEATFNPELLFRFQVFDLIVLGEGERPLKEIAARLAAGQPLDKVPGTAQMNPFGLNRYTQHSLSSVELRDAIFHTPYERMPYREYWRRLELAYSVGELPVKAQREARLAEIRSVRLITLNYCPMGCTFCSSTNFLNEAKGSVAPIARLDAEDCLKMIRRICSIFPDVRSIIFQDDIFVFTSDQRLVPLCKSIIEAKRIGDIPANLSFISTNRIDAMSPERLHWMRQAGFRVLGFGIESFSDRILTEFNKSKIIPHIEPNLTEAIRLGITPFLDLILTSPHALMEDLAQTINRAYRWLTAGCEMGMYPWVIPFSGAALATDPALREHTQFTTHHVRGTDISWTQPQRILPLDNTVRWTILEAADRFDAWIKLLLQVTNHIPSRIRSVVWILCLAPLLRQQGFPAPDPEAVFRDLIERLPILTAHAESELANLLAATAGSVYEFV